MATQREFDAILRSDFESFMAAAFCILHPGKVLDVEWLHRAMAHVLEQCLSGEWRRLIVTMPPRSLKSVIISVMFPAWLLGRDPSTKLMCVSYAEELTRRHSVDTRRLMTSAFYRRLFPMTVLRKETELVLETTQGGSRFATTVGGTVTGLGADWIIIDDPSKADDALSRPLIEKATTFFTNTLSTRLNDPAHGRIVLTMQRLHEADLAGYLLELGGWHHLALPATAEEDEQIRIGPNLVHHRYKGDLLEPRRVPQARLDEKRRELGSVAYQAQYQQKPQPAEGNIIKRDWLCFYAEAPDLASARIIQSVDTAQKTNPANDYSVLTTWANFGDCHYLLDVTRGRYDFPALVAQIITQHDRHRPERLLIEDTGSGIPLIQDLKAKRPDICAYPVKAKQPKDVRIGAASALFENRQVLFPKDAPWLDACLGEVLAYPSSKHDDIIDSIAQYLNWVRSQSHVEFHADFGHDEPSGVRAIDPEWLLAMGPVLHWR